ncbi:MAG: TonB family protein [Deltaproteobacteria bacterium]|nr:TonB family protein [Deltaproteobacteria bacterium]
MRMKPQRASMSAASARKPKPTRAPRMGLADRPSMVENFQERLSGETVQGGHQPTADATLARIYDRLARARHYPPLARARRHVGSPVVRFQIQPDGSIADLNLLTSCGIPLLDDAALQTVRRAAPFPYFPRPITVPIQYRLSPQ